jgi:hypothetical protein
LEPERMSEPTQKFVATIVVNNRLANDRTQTGHTPCQPFWYVPTMQRQVSTSGFTPHESDFPRQSCLRGVASRGRPAAAKVDRKPTSAADPKRPEHPSARPIRRHCLPFSMAWGRRTQWIFAFKSNCYRNGLRTVQSPLADQVGPTMGFEIAPDPQASLEACAAVCS